MAEGPAWLEQWPVAHPRVEGDWTLVSPHGFAKLTPETGDVTSVCPVADERLPALPVALERGRLLGYRIGRRAVIDAGASFIKVVRRKRLADAVGRHVLVSTALGNAIQAPTVLASSRQGRFKLSRVAGSSLHDVIRGSKAGGQARLAAALSHSADLVAQLHSSPVLADIDVAPVTPLADSLMLLRRGEGDADELTRQVALTLPLASPAPTEYDSATVLAHGDLHDKNIFVAGGRPGGLIDFDGAGRGRAEGDVGNLAAHLVLRSLQGGGSVAEGLWWASHFIRAYRDSRSLDTDALTSVSRHTWFRLACLYRFRRSSRRHVPALLGLAASDSPFRGQR